MIKHIKTAIGKNGTKYRILHDVRALELILQAFDKETREYVILYRTPFWDDMHKNFEAFLRLESQE